MRNLLLSSLLCLGILGCGKGISPYLNLQKSVDNQTVCMAQLKPQFARVLYDTKVDVIGKHLSGLLFFKQMPDSSIRVVFSSEMGLNFVDFEYAKSGFKVISIMKQLDRKIVIKQLKNDIGLLMMYGFDPNKASLYKSDSSHYYKFKNGKEETFYIADEKCTQLTRVENVFNHHKKVIINMVGRKGEMPDSAYIAHQTFDFTINLKQLKR